MGLVIKTTTEMKISSNFVRIHFPHFTIMNLLKCEIMWAREIKTYTFHSFLYAKERAKRKIKYMFNLVLELHVVEIASWSRAVLTLFNL